MALTINQEKQIRSGRLDPRPALLEALAKKVGLYRRAQKLPGGEQAVALRKSLLIEIDELLGILGVS